MPERFLFPYPRASDVDRERAGSLLESFLSYAKESIDPRRMERERWVGEEVVRDLGALGLWGVSVPPEFGGQGLSGTASIRLAEAGAQVDPALAVVAGIHQSIGMKGLLLFGTDEQKERLLPDLAAGRKLAGFALTEQNAGSDIFSLESRATRQPDGSWRLNGEKRYVGNGSTGATFVVIARAEVGGRDRHIALIVERGVDGFEVGERYDMLGIEANDVRPMYFRDVRVPAENVLGEPGEGIPITMDILNYGRLGLAAVALGTSKQLADLMLEHVASRRQFGRPLADLELVQERIAWSLVEIFALEAMIYLTSGLIDEGLPEHATESAVCKIKATEFSCQLADEVLQIRGGEGYMRREPYEKLFRDVRVFKIFEGANDVLRAFAVLSNMREMATERNGTPPELASPWPDSPLIHPALAGAARAAGEQVTRLGATSRTLLAEHGTRFLNRQRQQRWLVDALADEYARVATISRTTQIVEEHGQERSARQLMLTDAFSEIASERAGLALDRIDRDDGERVASLAGLAYRRGAYGHAFSATAPLAFPEPDPVDPVSPDDRPRSDSAAPAPAHPEVVT